MCSKERKVLNKQESSVHAMILMKNVLGQNCNMSRLQINVFSAMVTQIAHSAMII